MIHGGPVYGATYTAHLTCHHHGLPLRCGAARPEVSLSCRAHSSFCSAQERVVFRWVQNQI